MRVTFGPTRMAFPMISGCIEVSGWLMPRPMRLSLNGSTYHGRRKEGSAALPTHLQSTTSALDSYGLCRYRFLPLMVWTSLPQIPHASILISTSMSGRYVNAEFLQDRSISSVSTTYHSLQMVSGGTTQCKIQSALPSLGI